MQLRSLLTLVCCLLVAGSALAQPANNKKKDLPLEAARTVSFTTNEASWMSLDVSPDGQTIVFDLLGDLYTIPITGGTATQITSGMAFDAQPRFSPDGKKIAFISDRSGGDNVWYLELGGEDTTQVTKGNGNLYASPEWSPDGKYIVASKGSGLGALKLWMYHAEGGSGIQLGGQPEAGQVLGAAFSPDGRSIWNTRRNQGSWQYNAQFPQYQLAIYDRETGETHGRTFTYGSAFAPTLSPDGKWLIYGTRHDEHTGLRIRDLETSQERWLAYPVQRDDQEGRATRDVFPAMSFTPDSRHLIAYSGGKIWKVPVAGGQAEEIPFTVNVNLPIGPEVTFDYPISDEPTLVAKQIRDAKPSPDGSRLAFTALGKLYVMDWPNGTPRQIASMGDVHQHDPIWSPDGQWIAYVTWGVEGGHLYKIRANGQGQPQQLSRLPAFYTNLAWSPDGGRIVASKSSAQAFLEETNPSGTDFVWFPANGGDATLIKPMSGFNSPHFTNNPDRIYAFSFSDGLISMRWDGTDVKSHVKVTGPMQPGATQPSNASKILMAPEGDQALAQVLNDLYLVTVPMIGGTTPTVNVGDPSSAAFPAKRLTEIGGQFPIWSRDARKVHWSIGNAHVVYDLDDAQAFADSLEAAQKAEENKPEEDAPADTTAQAPADSTQTEATKDEPKKYKPFEQRISISFDRDIPQGSAVLRGARIITMRGDEVIERGDVVVQNNRITAVGPTGQVTVPQGAQVIDVSGKTIVPGFVDVHAHMVPSNTIFRTQVWEYLTNLAYGVTTTRDPQTGTADVLTYADMVDAGMLLGPRVYHTGPGVGFFNHEQIKDLDHARTILRRYSEYYDTKTIKMYLTGNRQQRQWIIMAAKELGLMPTTEGAIDFKLNLTQIIDAYPGHEHSFPVAPLYKDVVELTKGASVTYTPTLLVSYGGPWAENFFYTTEQVHDDPKLRRFTPHFEVDQKALQRPWFHEMRQVYDDHAKFVKQLVEAGGRAGVGAHGQLQGLGYHWELWAMQSGGLDEHDALRAATIFGAEAIGLDNDLGSIEPGKLADLVVLDGNPLENIRNTNTIRMVMMNGRLFDANTLNETYPRQRPLGRVWWQNLEPTGVPALDPQAGR